MTSEAKATVDPLSELKRLVAANVARYRVLADWDVVVRKDGDYLGSVTVHPDMKRALVRPPEPGTHVGDYAIHEVLHVAMAAVRRADDAHKAEELLVQDLCVGILPSTPEPTGELCEDCSSSARALRHDVRHAKPEDCPHYTPGDLDTSHE